MWIELLSLLLAASTPAGPNAFSCGGLDVDLRRPGQSAEHLPILDQGDTYLCAQFTTANLIDAWRTREARIGREGEPLSRRTSPLALGIEFASSHSWPLWMPIQNTTDPLSTISGRWGGTVCPLVRFARENGVCTDPSLRDTGPQSGEQALQARLAYEKIHAQGATDPYGKLRDEFLPGCRAETNRLPVPELPACETALYGGLDFLGLGKVRDELRKEGPLRKLREILSAQNPLPPAIAYCGAVLREGHGYRPRSILSGSCRAHWSLVIGMRSRTDGRCEVLIRNSAGPNTSEYSEEWARDAGDLWIDAETLNRSIYAIEWLGANGSALALRQAAR